MTVLERFKELGQNLFVLEVGFVLRTIVVALVLNATQLEFGAIAGVAEVFHVFGRLLNPADESGLAVTGITRDDKEAELASRDCIQQLGVQLSLHISLLIKVVVL